MSKKPFTHSSWALCKRLMRSYLRDHRWRIAAALILMAVVAASQAALAGIMEPILDDVFVSKDRDSLYFVAIGMMAIFASKGFAGYGQAVLMDFVGQKIVAKIQSQLFAHLVGADLAFFHRTQTGTLVSHFNHDMLYIRQALTKAFTGIGKDFLTLVALIGMMFYTDWRLSLIAFLAFPTAIIPIVKMGKRMRKVSINVQGEMGMMTNHLTQSFQGVRHIKAYGQEEREMKTADGLINKVMSLSHKAARTRALSRPIIELLGGLVIMGVITYGGHQVINNVLTPGQFFAFITSMLLAYEPVKRLANLNMNLQEGLAAAQRIFARLDEPHTILERNDAGLLLLQKGEISFKKVSFGYADEKVLDKLSLDIPAGKTVAFVGVSGAGKSTILNLIPRFYDVEAGKILIDGTDIRDVTLRSLRDNIALVSQDVFLFDASVRENITYGRQNANEDEVINAAKSAAAHDFIMELPQGYDTVIGENGVNLSGGQRQRLSIARAMIKNAPILLLDEATSSLDTESEQQIQEALKVLMKDRTTMVIAHRLSTIMDADVIHVIENGQVIQSGTHKQLLKDKKGVYAKLNAAQKG